MEIWKDIKGYEGYYKISNTGKVRNAKTDKILVGDINSVGYRRVYLYVPTPKRFFIHRLVAIHFVDGRSTDRVVNHIDGNKLNNNYKNLEWVSRSENDIHAYRLGLRTAHPSQFKHKIIQYNLLSGAIIKVYENIDECTAALNVKRSNVYSCCNGKQKSCRGFGLRYET